MRLTHVLSAPKLMPRLRLEAMVISASATDVRRRAPAQRTPRERNLQQLRLGLAEVPRLLKVKAGRRRPTQAVGVR